MRRTEVVHSIEQLWVNHSSHLWQEKGELSSAANTHVAHTIDAWSLQKIMHFPRPNLDRSVSEPMEKNSLEEKETGNILHFFLIWELHSVEHH